MNNSMQKYQKYIESLESIINKYDVCKSHGIEHAKTVMNNSFDALKSENTLSESDKEAVILASLLHDADDKKFFPNNIHNENTREILSDKSNDFIELVIQMINLVSSSTNRDNIPDDIKDKQWMLIPRYSDRLEAIGIIGIQRCYKYNMTTRAPLFIDSTPKLKTEEEIINLSLKKYETYQGNSLSMIDHFYDKLIAICTFPIKNKYLEDEAAKRKQPLIDFVIYFSQNGEINMDIINN